MNFFIVSQRERREYIWAPDDKYYHHKFVQEIKKGDIIFIYHKTYIVGISEAKNNAQRLLRPEFKNTNWGENGFNVKLNITDLKIPVKVNLYKEVIVEFKEKTGKYFPFKADGFIVQGYTYKIDGEFSNYLFSLIKSHGNEKIVEYYDNKLESYELDEIRLIQNNLNLSDTEKISATKQRVGQSRFRENLLNRERKCKICEIKQRSMLVASHIKPWSKSKAEERLDVNNGFLFCPNHDKLFDRYLISFCEEGKILVSKKIREEEKIHLGVNEDIEIELNDEQKNYLNYHRKEFSKREENK